MQKPSTRRMPAGGEVFTQTARKLAAASPAPSGISHDWMGGLGLVLAVFLAYTPVWQAGFIWDDDLQLMANPCIVGPLGLKEIWTTADSGYYPLVLTTFWVEHALWGLAPLPYHLVNVLMHGACAVLLWRVLRNLQAPGAWLGAALWALHPVQVETAAWITELKNTQSGLFFLLSILFFIKYLKTRGLDARSAGGGNYALTLLFTALAMASKPSTVVLPVVLALCAWWVEGRWAWRNLARVGPVALMAVLSCALTLWTQKLSGAYDPRWARSWPERLAGAGDAVWFYLGKLAWPHPLIFIYPRWEIAAGEWSSYLPLLAVLIALYLLWSNRKTWSRPLFFVFAYFLAALLPVLGLVDGYFWRYSLVGDHFQYLAAMGPLALAGAGLTQLSDFLIPGRRWLQSSLGAGLLLVLGGLSWQRAWVYESLETLWTDTIAQNPRCWMAHNNLGEILLQKGRPDDAMAEYDKALEIYPNYVDAIGNLGMALYQKGQVDGAIAQYQKVLALDPNDAKAHNNLGIARASTGQADEAVVQFQETLAIDPYNAEAHYNLGNVLAQRGRMDGAIAEYQQALRIDPNNAGAHNNLGNAYSQEGRLDEAIDQYQKYLALDPNDARVHDNLGLVFLEKGRGGEAMAQFQEALRLQPDDADAQRNLARAEVLTR